MTYSKIVAFKTLITLPTFKGPVTPYPADQPLTQSEHEGLVVLSLVAPFKEKQDMILRQIVYPKVYDLNIDWLSPDKFKSRETIIKI